MKKTSDKTTKPFPIRLLLLAVLLILPFALYYALQGGHQWLSATLYAVLLMCVVLLILTN
jgi:hypothetical protein